MEDRFGNRTADRIVVFASQYIADSLHGEGDQFFRWDGTTFVALVRRDADFPEVKRELSGIGGRSLEYFVEHGGRRSPVLIALRVSILPLSQVPAGEVTTAIERVAGLASRV